MTRADRKSIAFYALYDARTPYDLRLQWAGYVNDDCPMPRAGERFLAAVTFPGHEQPPQPLADPLAKDRRARTTASGRPIFNLTDDQVARSTHQAKRKEPREALYT